MTDAIMGATVTAAHVVLCPRHASVDKLVEALKTLESWAEAYPLDIFPEPDFTEIAKVLKAAGHSIDTVSASNMRHVIKQTKGIVRAALASVREGKEST